MARTKKWSQKPEEPRWFTHNGAFNTNPSSVKKNGAGKNNWGKPGDELDDEEVAMYQKSTGRRNSNHEINQERFNNLNNQLDDKLMM
ncbi:TMA10 Translation machinery-associated protein 10 [Candida maltosa Xu316]|uniref:STF2-like protein, putative n=1 Tax=Candida maltosa (strain Xu316) TaxID=1245528 RepID=M3HU38_CANMX|nr:STF2-like protein, putative [Candida maltosa Xu316]